MRSLPSTPDPAWPLWKSVGHGSPSIDRGRHLSALPSASGMTLVDSPGESFYAWKYAGTMSSKCLTSPLPFPSWQYVGPHDP